MGAGSAYATIQQAVNSGCSKILVKPGTYYENVVIPAAQTVSITGLAGAAKTIVDGGGAGSVFTINSGANVTLTGLTIQNGSAFRGGGISNAGSLTLNQSIIADNTAAGPHSRKRLTPDRSNVRTASKKRTASRTCRTQYPGSANSSRPAQPPVTVDTTTSATAVAYHVNLEPDRG